MAKTKSTIPVAKLAVRDRLFAELARTAGKVQVNRRGLAPARFFDRLAQDQRFLPRDVARESDD